MNKDQILSILEHSIKFDSSALLKNEEVHTLYNYISELEQELEDRAYTELKESYFRLQEENRSLLDRIYRLIKQPTDIGLVLVELDRWLKKEVAYKEVEKKIDELKKEYFI